MSHDSSDHASDSLPASSYPELDIPEFKSQIPAHLLAASTPAEQHIISELSKLGQFADWSVRAHLSTNGQVRRTNGRLLKAEAAIADIKDDRRTIVRGWRFIAAIIAGIGGVAGLGISVYGMIAGK